MTKENSQESPWRRAGVTERRHSVQGETQPRRLQKMVTHPSPRGSMRKGTRLDMALERMLLHHEGRLGTGPRVPKASRVLVRPKKRGGRGFWRRRKQRELRGRIGKRWRKRGKGSLKAKTMEVGEDLGNSSNLQMFHMEGRRHEKFEESQGAKTLVVFSPKKGKVKEQECEQDQNCSHDMVCLNGQCLPKPL